MSINHWIDDDDATTDSVRYFDKSNNFTFVVSRRNDTTFISPIATEGLKELKIGVLLPFHQKDSEATKQLTLSGASAIRMAVAEINTQHMIPGAYITLIEKDSYPKEAEGQESITQAVYAAVALIQEGVIGVIGDVSSSWTSLSALMTSTLQIPQCSFSAVATSLSDKTQYGYFFRTISTNLAYADAALSFVLSQGWPVVGILYTDDDFGQQLSENMIMKARLQGIKVKSYLAFYSEGPTSNVQKAVDTLMATGTRIVLLAAESDAQLTALTIAGQLGYINNDTVWITFGDDTDTLATAVSRFNSAIQQRISHPNSPIVNGNNTNQWMTDVDPIIYAANTSRVTATIPFNDTFSGGVFTFRYRLNLTGYAPFDEFMGKWAKLDPKIYPYGGQMNISSNEGAAYSCMMAMAHGFNQVLQNSTNTNSTMKKLAAGQLGQYMTPSTFNTSFVGPEGPVLFDDNGDIMVSNFRVFNLQKGNSVYIGSIIANDLHLISEPIYHDGTSKVPTGVPNLNILSTSSTPMTYAILSVASFGILAAMVTILLVLCYRKREVFKASSPLFCVLELLGFISAYVSVLFFSQPRTKANCIIIPIAFHLGYALILGNLIAKNYRIYRIFNNIFITRTVVRDFQLLKVSGGIVVFDAIILTVWLGTSDVQTVDVPVSATAYYVGCDFHGPANMAFVWILTIFAAGQLAFATFLAFKTRSVGKNYSKYSEYKQIGLSVYNIFFSATIGFVIFFMPTTDYFTQHYLTATMIVWASTFSLMVLFVPKLHRFFFQRPSSTSPGKASDLTGRKRSQSMNELSNHSRPEQQQQEQQSHGELMSLGRMISSGNPLGRTGSKKQSQPAATVTSQGVVLEAHEARIPVQRISRYWPFLAAWDMKNIILFPGFGYFSWISEQSKKGTVFGYSHAAIVSSVPDNYILKVHGLGWSDVLIQVSNQQELQQWYSRFNRASADESQETCLSSQTYLTSQSSEPAVLTDADKMDSNLTSRHLLSETRRQSTISVDTMDSCMNAPAVDELGSDERRATLSSLSSNNPFLHPPLPTQPPPPLSLSCRRRSGRTADDNGRSSFYSAFVGYLSTSEQQTPWGSNPANHAAASDDIMMKNVHTKN